MKYQTYIMAALICAPFTLFADNNIYGGCQHDNLGMQKLAYNPHGDRDRDGIPNYRDRVNDNGPNGDRDHDGVLNKNEQNHRHIANPYGDKDHDGIANIRDDHDNRLDTPKNR